VSGRYFLDTNIFVYTFDETADFKRERAKALVEGALADT
jgi:predicted nucleic acid-binding protein